MKVSNPEHFPDVREPDWEFEQDYLIFVLLVRLFLEQSEQRFTIYHTYFAGLGLALWKSARQRIITVDNYRQNPWRLPPEQHYALAAQVLFCLVQRGEVEQVRMDKSEFYRVYDGPAPALVFIDAVHTYEHTKADVQWARRVGASIICGHDYCERFPGVMQAVDESGRLAQLRGSLWSL